LLHIAWSRSSGGVVRSIARGVSMAAAKAVYSAALAGSGVSGESTKNSSR
jgi:hypothetical protein